jgi:DNA polymerase III epsilon subunit-like protein
MTPVVVVADVETTGLRANHCVTEVGAYAIALPTREFVSYGEVQVQLTPAQEALMTVEAMQVQGWTLERNKNGMPFEQAREQIQAWLAGLNVLGFVAHNADFDRYHLERQGFVPRGATWYCTRKGLQAYERLKRVKLANQKLASLAEACGYQNPDAHRAGADALVAAHGYLWLTAQGVRPDEMRL